MGCPWYDNLRTVGSRILLEEHRQAIFCIRSLNNNFQPVQFRFHRLFESERTLLGFAEFSNCFFLEGYSHLVMLEMALLTIENLGVLTQLPVPLILAINFLLRYVLKIGFQIPAIHGPTAQQRLSCLLENVDLRLGHVMLVSHFHRPLVSIVANEFIFRIDVQRQRRKQSVVKFLENGIHRTTTSKRIGHPLTPSPVGVQPASQSSSGLLLDLASLLQTTFSSPLATPRSSWGKLSSSDPSYHIACTRNFYIDNFGNRCPLYHRFQNLIASCLLKSSKLVAASSSQTRPKMGPRRRHTMNKFLINVFRSSPKSQSAASFFRSVDHSTPNPYLLAGLQITVLALGTQQASG